MTNSICRRWNALARGLRDSASSLLPSPVLRCRYFAGFCLLLAACGLVPLVASAKARAPALASAGAPGFEPRYAIVNDERVRVFERKNADGLVVAQTIFGRQYQAFWLDRDGDGRADYWEAADARGSVSLHELSGNHFLFMDVEQRADSGRVQMKFVYDPRAGDYSLYAATRVHYARLSAYQNFIVNCEGDAFDRKLKESTMALDAALASGNSGLLRQAVTKIVAASDCARPPFGGTSQKNIVEAVMRVAMSDQDYTGSRPGRDPEQPIKTGNYLHCLRDFNMDAHASRIGAAFAQLLLPALGKPTLVPSPAEWSLTCADIPGEGGSFDNHPGIVSLTQPGMSVDDYAQKFFHEMVHYSLIDDERVTGAIENCCGRTAATAADERCAVLGQIVKWKAMGQRFQNLLAEREKGAVSALLATMRLAVGENADGLLDNFYLEAGKLYEKYRVDGACHKDARAKDSVLGACEPQFRQDLINVLSAYFGTDMATGKAKVGLGNRRCNAEAMTAFSQNKGEADLYCDALRQLAEKVLGIDTNKVKGQSACSRLAGISWSRRLWALLGSASARAEDEMAEATKQICSDLAAAVPAGSLDILNKDLYGPLNQYSGVGPLRAPSGAELDSAAQAAGKTARLNSPPVSQAAIPVGSLGQQAPFTSSGGPQRDQAQAAVGSYINNLEDTLSTTRLALESLSRVAFPAAAAASAAPGASPASAGDAGPGPLRARRVADSSASPGASSEARDASPASSAMPASLPKLHIPDPLAGGPIAPSYALNAPGAPSGSAASGALSAPAVPSGAQAARAAVPGAGNNGPAGNALNGSGQDPWDNPRAYAKAGWSNFGAGARGPSSQEGPSDLSAAREQASRRAAAFKAFLARMEDDYSIVKPDLSKTEVVRAMRDFGVQAIDDEGLAHGSGDPTCRLRYNASARRLARALEPPCRARQP
jgi:hypothetical protein